MLPTIVVVDDDHDYFETTMKTLKTTMGLEIIKMKMRMKMKINKALIDCPKNVIALAALVLRSLTIMTSQVRAMQFKKHAASEGAGTSKLLVYSYKHAQGVSLLLNFV